MWPVYAFSRSSCPSSSLSIAAAVVVIVVVIFIQLDSQSFKSILSGSAACVREIFLCIYPITVKRKNLLNDINVK